MILIDLINVEENEIVTVLTVLNQKDDRKIKLLQKYRNIRYYFVPLNLKLAVQRPSWVVGNSILIRWYGNDAKSAYCDHFCQPIASGISLSDLLHGRRLK